ncbi:hypothetical protein HBO12_27280 [Pseudomonas sp. WS 5059]|jgi:hypothetical protein|uniref:PA3371 family protein n=1 Tax=unclassified Pseudomonas TaxID=196821 RepID=UPI0014729D59|nr:MULTISPECIES: PA3371 family protein [unclassified Pseudomonas]NMX62799.1 hypothetical protein [Pseudomonas sp. WS 5079]NMX69365.1 hypothetical protein [Pseudomonas sp. WS 5111]NMX87235.1 hypothetical protein [Pseudomonas sp. WS 5010]NMY06663.1 hypothetical protein [Pseudomonas sp. WS 5059]NMY25046.1 hypothetical protein [Pseudomonas sp. WS 5021]
MTKTTWLFFILTLITGVMGLSATSNDWHTLSLGACAVFASAWVIAAIVGRRFKFDPVLR